MQIKRSPLQGMTHNKIVVRAGEINVMPLSYASLDRPSLMTQKQGEISEKSAIIIKNGCIPPFLLSFENKNKKRGEKKEKKM